MTRDTMRRSAGLRADPHDDTPTLADRLARWGRRTRLGVRRVGQLMASAAYHDTGTTIPSSIRPKLGFLHIPKSGGSSLNESLYAAFGLEQAHVTSLVPKNAPTVRNPRRAVVEGSMTHVLARNMPFLAGHITYTALKSLKREFIFTVLRDPRERVISLYTYSKKRSGSPKTLKRHPALAKYADQGFVEYMTQQQPYNNMATLLLSDVRGWEKMKNPANRENRPAGLNAFIDTGLRRLDVVYACGNQEVLDDLYRRGLISTAREVTKNVSEGTFDFGQVSRKQMLELLDRATWLDRLVYERAAVLFPETVSKPMLSDEQFLANLERRFDVKFSD